ncbi:MAG: hypothetical protein KKD77_24570 [Gammaproteobacteria bacterium]|nr:hypothetical protein [Gammaproteobacteria bacterium]
MRKLIITILILSFFARAVQAKWYRVSWEPGHDPNIQTDPNDTITYTVHIDTVDGRLHFPVGEALFYDFDRPVPWGPIKLWVTATNQYGDESFPSDEVKPPPPCPPENVVIGAQP